MNTRIDVVNNTLTDGVETPVGTLYAVENPDPNFPGISIFIKRKEKKDAEEILWVESDAIRGGGLRALVYPNVLDFDAEPEIINFNFESHDSEG